MAEAQQETAPEGAQSGCMPGCLPDCRPGCLPGCLPCSVLGWLPNSHDVGLVDGSDPAPPFLPGQFKGVLCDPQGVNPCDDLETFHHSGDTLQEAHT